MLEKFLYYLNPKTFFTKSTEPNINTRMMHGMNRISILMFLMCLGVIIYKYLHLN
ncbi:MAG: DUF6728 family protein [Bacteroidia bacterium]